jgi:hypothetical protein
MLDVLMIFYLIKGVGQPHWKGHQGTSQPDTDDYNPEDKCMTRKGLRIYTTVSKVVVIYEDI